MALRGVPEIDRCLVMGVLNVTPDSFSDGGAWADSATAIRHGLAMVEDGAHLVDVGGESTRPGADRVPEEEERARVLPVVRALADAGVFVSIDTMRGSVAAAAVDAGARMVNDVSGGRADPELLRVVAATGVPLVVMHWRGHSATMQAQAAYDDVVGEVCGELRAQLDAVVAAGVDPGQVVLDPGLGFAKEAAHNWALLAHLDDLAALGRPLLIGASRKSLLGALLANGSEPRPVGDRVDASVAVAAIAAYDGVWGVRVHDVRPTVDAVRVAAAVRAAR